MRISHCYRYATDMLALANAKKLDETIGRVRNVSDVPSGSSNYELNLDRMKKFVV